MAKKWYKDFAEHWLSRSANDSRPYHVETVKVLLFAGHPVWRKVQVLDWVDDSGLFESLLREADTPIWSAVSRLQEPEEITGYVMWHGSVTWDPLAEEYKFIGDYRQVSSKEFRAHAKEYL